MSNKIQHFDGPTFEADVLQAGEPVVVDFYADWCHPCHMMGPVIEQLAGEFAGKVKIGKLDVDANEDIAIRYGVMGIPTLGLFSGGKMVDRLVGCPGGAAPIMAWVEKHANTAAVKSQALDRQRRRGEMLRRFLISELAWVR